MGFREVLFVVWLSPNYRMNAKRLQNLPLTNWNKWNATKRWHYFPV